MLAFIIEVLLLLTLHLYAFIVCAIFCNLHRITNQSTTASMLERSLEDGVIFDHVDGKTGTNAETSQLVVCGLHFDSI